MISINKIREIIIREGKDFFSCLILSTIFFLTILIFKPGAINEIEFLPLLSIAIYLLFKVRKVNAKELFKLFGNNIKIDFSRVIKLRVIIAVVITLLYVLASNFQRFPFSDYNFTVLLLQLIYPFANILLAIFLTINLKKYSVNPKFQILLVWLINIVCSLMAVFGQYYLDSSNGRIYNRLSQLSSIIFILGAIELFLFVFKKRDKESK